MSQKTNINFKCPICKNQEYLTDDNEETYCKTCGLVITSPYPYTAGQRWKTLSDYQIEKTNLIKKQRRTRKWKLTMQQQSQHGQE